MLVVFVCIHKSFGCCESQFTGASAPALGGFVTRSSMFIDSFNDAQVSSDFKRSFSRALSACRMFKDFFGFLFAGLKVFYQ